MAKRNRQTTATKIEKMIKEGRGQGEGKDYKPWIVVQDVPSEGRATRGVGWTTGRKHELLSDIERDYCYLLDYMPEVTDIREQYPLLPLEETLLIAESIGVDHPADPQTKEPVVMTSDFMITYKDKEFVRTVKPSSKLDDDRVIAKFEIERRYWASRNMDWGIITDSDLPDALIRNIEWIHREYHNDAVKELTPYIIANIEKVLAKRLLEGAAISKSCLEIDQQLGFDGGTCLTLFRHFIARGVWNVDMMELIIPSLPAKSFTINTANLRNIALGG